MNIGSKVDYLTYVQPHEFSGLKPSIIAFKKFCGFTSEYQLGNQYFSNSEA